MSEIQITSAGVKRSLSKFSEIEAILEYIWNGFDARANKIEITTTHNEMGLVKDLYIKDNGTGIEKNKLKEKFTPFFQSEKIEKQLQEKRKQNSTYHGKNGVGRLTFFKFSNNAEWETVYNNLNGENKKYNIFININDLTKYESTEEVLADDQECGTLVKFKGLHTAINLKELEKDIKNEFCWYLILNKNNNFSITINNKPLDLSDMIQETDEGTLQVKEYKFEWYFVNWKNTLNKEYSRYYFSNSDDKELFKEYTTYNNKGDKFYHSLFVKSNFFDNFVFKREDLESSQYSIFQSQNDIYKLLIYKLDNIISDKRNPYIREYSKKVIKDLEEAKAFDNYNDNDIIDKYKKDNLQKFIEELYVIEPKIFTSLNKEQKVTMVRLFDASMNANDRESLFKIITSVLDLSIEERRNLSKVLEETPLNNITKTINFLNDRLKALNYFEQAVYNENLNANEVNHLQKMLESNYWLFGEQYTIVAAAEDNFVKLVENHLSVLRKEDGDENEIIIKKIKDNSEKQKQVDLCCIRQMSSSDNIENIIVEIKHPLKTLTQTHYRQVRKYMDIITSIKEFNADNYKWTFYLVGTKISQSLQDDINVLKDKGKPNLVFEKNNFQIEIFVRTWKSIFNEYKIKYNTIYNKLKTEEEKIVSKLNTIEDVLTKQKLISVN